MNHVKYWLHWYRRTFDGTSVWEDAMLRVLARQQLDSNLRMALFAAGGLQS